ncbi:glycosyltransferase [Idiomarina piscisalsi]|uniref:Glycosyl transferase family 1 domain-containing protein n=1 Tax=Idiomarina piscisalsi TaxID=1096243 RepID=A0A432YRH4_9GAMM|nr:glycosyltransferase [Idiomarina piscisalsi]RUO64311.1 hypothetical protein CWI73_09145 [Idiomarina piscisalsi]
MEAVLDFVKEIQSNSKYQSLTLELDLLIKKFDKPIICSFVYNDGVSDARVYKTSKSMEAFYTSVLIGFSSKEYYQIRLVGNVINILVPNPMRIYNSITPGSKDKNRLDKILSIYSILVTPLFEKISPAVIYGHDVYGAFVAYHAYTLYLSLPTSVSLNPKIIYDAHEYVNGLTNIDNDKQKLMQDYERFIIRRTDGVVTVSESIANQIELEHEFNGLIGVTFNSPYADDFINSSKPYTIRTDPELKIPEGSKIGVWNGGLNYVRGPHTVVECLKYFPNLHLVFLSPPSSPYLNVLYEIAERDEVIERLHVKGVVEYSELTRYISTADFGWHGALHDILNTEYAMPNKLFEYYIAGINILVSDVIEMSNFVRNEECGEIYLANDIDSCKKALTRILENNQRYERDILKKSWENQTQKINKFIRSVLETGASKTSNFDELSSRFEKTLEIEQVIFAMSLKGLNKKNIGTKKINFSLDTNSDELEKIFGFDEVTFNKVKKEIGPVFNLHDVFSTPSVLDYLLRRLRNSYRELNSKETLFKLESLLDFYSHYLLENNEAEKSSSLRVVDVLYRLQSIIKALEQDLDKEIEAQKLVSRNFLHAVERFMQQCQKGGDGVCRGAYFLDSNESVKFKGYIKALAANRDFSKEEYNKLRKIYKRVYEAVKIEAQHESISDFSSLYNLLEYYQITKNSKFLFLFEKIIKERLLSCDVIASLALINKTSSVFHFQFNLLTDSHPSYAIENIVCEESFYKILSENPLFKSSPTETRLKLFISLKNIDSEISYSMKESIIASLLFNVYPTDCWTELTNKRLLLKSEQD